MDDVLKAAREMLSLPWLLTYETAVMSRWHTESAAWVAHDRAVIQGLDPDKLAVLKGRP